jgi:hypothetical protein
LKFRPEGLGACAIVGTGRVSMPPSAVPCPYPNPTPPPNPNTKKPPGRRIPEAIRVHMDSQNAPRIQGVAPLGLFLCLLLGFEMPVFKKPVPNPVHPFILRILIQTKRHARVCTGHFTSCFLRLRSVSKFLTCSFSGTLLRCGLETSLKNESLD